MHTVVCALELTIDGNEEKLPKFSHRSLVIKCCTSDANTQLVQSNVGDSTSLSEDKLGGSITKCASHKYTNVCKLISCSLATELTVVDLPDSLAITSNCTTVGIVVIRGHGKNGVIKRNNCDTRLSHD